MSNYIKYNNSWIEIFGIYKKVNNTWQLQNDTLQNILANHIYFYNSAQIDISSFYISGISSCIGKTFNLQGILNNRVVPATWTITSGSSYASINENGKVTINSGVQNQTITVQAVYSSFIDTKTITISYDNQLTIESANTISGTSGNVIARYNGEIVNPVWTINSGGLYGTINSSGEITIISSGNIEVQASYSGYTATKTITLIYDAGTTTTTTVDEDGNVTTETTTTTQNQDGSSTTSTTTTTINEDGSSSSTETSTTQNQDGSSSTTSTTNNSDGSSSETTSTTTAPDENGSTQSSTTTTNYDENGDVTGSQGIEQTNNSDGSSATSTTNYNADGDPTDQTNNTIDTSGNSNTQNIEYDENGNSTVTAYTIDTTGNEDGTGETITGEGVNTEFMPFDGSDGFELHIRFYSRKQDQPNPPVVVDTEDTSANLHFTILCSKDPSSPYPGFHIRWTLSKTNYNSGNLVFGYRGRTGSAKNQNLVLSKNNDMYDFTISYDPNLKKYPSKFRCQDNLNGGALITLNLDFNPLAYGLTLGYNINQQGQPYRYSNVTIHEFSINKL